MTGGVRRYRNGVQGLRTRVSCIQRVDDVAGRTWMKLARDCGEYELSEVKLCLTMMILLAHFFQLKDKKKLKCILFYKWCFN